MTNLFKKIATSIVGMAMAIGVGVAVGDNNKENVPASAASQNWTKITTMPQSGSKYLIVDSSNDYLLDATVSSTNIDSSDNSSSVIISNGKISGVDDSKAWVFTNAGTYWNIGNGSFYIGRNANSNGINQTATASDDNAKNTISNSSGTFTISGNGGRQLRYNSQSGQEKFRYFASGTVFLFEIDTGSGDPETITVSYNANGGEGTMSASTVTDGSVTLTANTFTRSKHAFTGWNTKANGLNGTAYANEAVINNITESFTLYAQWSQNEWDVTYSANGGSGTMAASTTSSNAAICTFVPPTNMVFSGWNTAANGNGTSYAVGADLSAITEDTTLYAQWTARPSLSGSEIVAYDMNCPYAGKSKNNGYATYYDVSISDVTWNAPGNQSITDDTNVWRIGGGNGSYTRTITQKSGSLSSHAITKMVLNHSGLSNASLKINYIQLQVGNSDFSEIVQTIKYTPSLTTSSGSIEFYASSNSLWTSSKYYKLSIDCTNTTSSNYGLNLTSLQFYYDYVSSDVVTNLTISSYSLTPVKGANVKTTLNGLTITASVNGVSKSYSNYSASVLRRNNEPDAVTDSTVFTVGDNKLIVTALDGDGNGSYESKEISLNVSFTPILTVGNTYALVYSGNVFTCDINSYKGTAASYSSTPASYGLLVENGLYSGTVSFKILSGTNANKYISWTSNTQLGLSENKTNLSSWIAFNDGENNIIANSDNEAGVLYYNGSMFAGYTSKGTNNYPSLLLLGTAKCDTFASEFMKMDSYDQGGTKGQQGSGDGHSCETYYPIAKAVFNGTATGENAQYNLSEDERLLIADANGLYTNAFERLKEWARINSDSYNGTSHLLEANKAGIEMLKTSSESSTVIVVVVTSLISITAFGAFLFLKKRKEQ